jgi:EmrB/QacA subfamily drug resistance transporter
MADHESAAAIGLASRRGRWVIAATVLGSSMAMLDVTAVNVALPAIGKDLHTSLGGLQWTVTAYTLTLAGLMLLGGALGDRLGRRRIFVTGVIWFAVASALCGLAPGIGLLVAARALQGMGAALLTPGSLAIIQATFAPLDRSRAIGAWAGLGAAATAMGPLLGGWIVGAVGWRWIFLINVPLAAVVAAVTLRHVPETRNPARHGRFDLAGAVLAAASLAGMTLALIEAPAHDLALPELAGTAGILAGAGFVLLERRRGRPGSKVAPMLPLALFARRQFTAVNVVTLVLHAALGGTTFLLMLQLQVVAGYSPLTAGLSLLPTTLLMLLGSQQAGALAQRFGPRWPMAGGSLVCAAGLLLAIKIGPGASYVADVLPPFTLFGLGLSAIVAPLCATVLASADVRHAGIASGVNNAVARAAGLVAVAGLPLAVGLTGPAYLDSAAMSSAFRTGMVVCACLYTAAAFLCATTISNNVLRTEPATGTSPSRSPAGPRPGSGTNGAAAASSPSLSNHHAS